MGRRPKYPDEVSMKIPKDITDLYETPVLKVLFTEREAEMAEGQTNGKRLWIPATTVRSRPTTAPSGKWSAWAYSPGGRKEASF